MYNPIILYSTHTILARMENDNPIMETKQYFFKNTFIYKSEVNMMIEQSDFQNQVQQSSLLYLIFDF